MRLESTLDTPERLEFAERLYLEAFPESERKPFDLLLCKQFEGSAELLCAVDDAGSPAAIVFTLSDGGYVLLDYLAVCPKYRGNGIGTEILSLLKRRYPGSNIVLEIESTASLADKGDLRLRRKAFYERNGFSANGYLVDLLGVDMEIMSVSPIPFGEYHALFEPLFGAEFACKVRYIG